MIRRGQHRCVLFDVDGTIAETEGQAHLPAFNQTMEEAGLGWRWTSADYKRLLKTTGGFERLLRFATESGQDAEALREKLAQVHKNKNRHFAAIMAAGAVAPRAGFRELVMHLARQKIGWGVVTTTSRGNWEALWTYSLAPVGVPAPEVIICGEDVAAKKPDPEAYLLALKRLGMAATECCAIEDSRNGLLAARAAGLEVAIVCSEYFADERFDEAARVVDELYFLQQDNL
jgi:HAD superfamily hydrolase (TIGR01509 family)